MTDFHNIWIEQCEAAEGIKERLGTRDATRYLIGEKLMNFLEASHESPEFAQELAKFIAEIKAIFPPHEIVAFFDDLQSGQVLDPATIFNGKDPADSDDSELDEFQVVHDAE